MLVLSRKASESIRIGDDITVTVVEIRGDKARLGIDVPLETPVHRQEVYDAIQRNGETPRVGAPGDGRLPLSVRRALAIVERYATRQASQGWPHESREAFVEAVGLAATRHVGAGENGNHSIG